MEHVEANGLVKLCCADKNNLKRHIITPDKCVDVCQECGCKHYRMKADTGHLGAKLNPLGK